MPNRPPPKLTPCAINSHILVIWQKTYIFFLKSCLIRDTITKTVYILSGILL